MLMHFLLLQESGTVRLEAQVQPANDPHLSIEWFKNSIQLVTGKLSNCAKEGRGCRTIYTG